MNFVRSAFRTVRENPALILAEIAWRWTFGAVAWLLVIFTVRTIMEGIDVSAAEVAIARSSNAYLIADAIARILVQVLPRLISALLIVVPALSVLWIAAATVGRAATLRSLLSPNVGDVILIKVERSARNAMPKRGIFSVSLVSLNVLRAVFSLATVLAFFGTVILVSSQAAPDIVPMLALAWMFLALLVGIMWGIVNWFLALAPIFIVRDGLGVGRAIAASLGLYRDSSREYMAIATWFGLFRSAALLFAIAAGSLTLAAGSVRPILAGSVVVALLYFAIADYLYIARLAAFVSLAVPGTSTNVLESTTPASDVSHLELET